LLDELSHIQIVGSPNTPPNPLYKDTDRSTVEETDNQTETRQKPDKRQKQTDKEYIRRNLHSGANRDKSDVRYTLCDSE
jgi:hypothetical protein